MCMATQRDVQVHQACFCKGNLEKDPHLSCSRLSPSQLHVMLCSRQGCLCGLRSASHLRDNLNRQQGASQ